jgi:plastocyanin
MQLRSGGFVLVLAAACGGSSPTGGGNPPPVQNVIMNDHAGVAPYAYSPATVTVKVGTTVKWTNNGGTAHTATSDATPQPIWNSGTVLPAGSASCPPTDPYCQPGGTPAGTYQVTFNSPGTYQYHCEFHGPQGMTGTITVTP